MEKLCSFTEYLSDIIWGPALLLFLLGSGFFLTLASGFFPLRNFIFIIKNTFGKILKNRKSFSAAATAIGATVGTGNIIGVASAIVIGGAGAVFWMWCGAFFGMMLKFAEAALAVKYHGGAMVYIEKALGKKFFPKLWCICCVLASFGGGNMIQTYAAGKTAEISFGINPIWVGFFIAILTGAVLFFGEKGVTGVSSGLVPAMALLYVAGCCAVLFICRNEIPRAIDSIFSSAFRPLSAGGGIFGLLLSKNLSVGISKGTFTHEAGMGSASVAHAESGESRPVIQGCWGIIEVFIDTFLVCSLTALVILSAGGKGFSENSVAEIFRGHFGFFGDAFLSVSLFLFALAAVIGWAFYGEKALFYVTESKAAKNIYRFVFCALAIIGSCSSLPLIWNITDIFNGLMIFPNLLAIIILSPEILKIARKKKER